MYVILAIVTVCVTIVVTYFLLNNEDYRWVCLAVWGALPHPGRAQRWAVAEARCVALGPLTHGHHCAPASQMALDGIRRVMLHGRLCVLVFGAAHHRQRLAPAARPMLSARVRRVQVYYFFVKTKMSGFFQTVFYFGYSAPPPLASLCCGPGPALPRCHSRACRCNGSVDFLRGPRRDVRHFGLLRLLRLRAPHLREYQVGLTLATRSPTTGSCAFGLRTSRVQGGGRAGVRLCRPT